MTASGTRPLQYERRYRTKKISEMDDIQQNKNYINNNNNWKLIIYSKKKSERNENFTYLTRRKDNLAELYLQRINHSEEMKSQSYTELESRWPALNCETAAAAAAKLTNVVVMNRTTKINAFTITTRLTTTTTTTTATSARCCM
ncbi:conserved hypothetical protein [Trichinella spiralis]|uniref:hypothetical protein n=1 Tax=Trichinella spiralis TaxID=6334 RepID=UPI0001EFC389|nr:conserved hypothetical protein [Trichinella spiralis]